MEDGEYIVKCIVSATHYFIFIGFASNATLDSDINNPDL